jgi:hypothetical protein
MVMRLRMRLSLFLSGLFFGGGLDHMILLASGSPRTHYGLTVSPAGQLFFASLDFGLATVLYLLHLRWSRSSPAVSSGR